METENTQKPSVRAEGNLSPRFFTPISFFVHISGSVSLITDAGYHWKDVMLIFFV